MQAVVFIFLTIRRKMNFAWKIIWLWMTIRFGEYKKRDISFLLNFVTNPFLYYTGYRWWTVNANFFRNKQHSFLKSRRFLWKKRIVTWLFEGKQDIIGNKSIHQVYAFIKSKRKKRKNRKKKSEKRETVRMRGNDWTKGKTGCNNENSGSNQKNRIVQEDGLLLYRSEDDLACCWWT